MILDSCGLCGKPFIFSSGVDGNIRQHFLSKHFDMHGLRGRNKNGNVR